MFERLREPIHLVHDLPVFLLESRAVVPPSRSAIGRGWVDVPDGAHPPPPAHIVALPLRAAERSLEVRGVLPALRVGHRLRADVPGAGPALVGREDKALPGLLGAGSLRDVAKPTKTRMCCAIFSQNGHFDWVTDL